MNLMVNNTCNRACPYCFAMSKVSLPDSALVAGPRNISLEDFGRYLDFHVASQLPQLKLLGGEPTLHPDFMELLRRAQERNLETLVLTNGLWPREIQCAMRSISMADWKLKFLFNVNEPHLQPASQVAQAKDSMKMAGKRGNCGFNIYRETFDIQFLADFIDECGLDRTVRLGLASPIFGKENAHVAAGYFKSIGRRLADQLRSLEKRNVLGWFDCGFPLCMFPEESLGSVVLSSRGFQSICDYPIDVGPELTAWPCFPLSDFETVRIADFQNAAEVQAHFAKHLSLFRRRGALDECLACKFMERDQCCGGCVAHALKALGGDASLQMDSAQPGK
jgi:hypothetical protein